MRMSYAGAVDVSSNSWVGYVDETTPGTTPATPTWVQVPVVQQGTTWPQLAPDRRPVRVLTSNANNIIGYIDAQGRVNAAILQPLIPTFIGNWLQACGLATTGSSGFATPQGTISLLDVYGEGTTAIDSTIYAGMRASRLTFAGSSSVGVYTLLTEFEGIVPPATTTGAGPTVPTPTYEDPYIHAGWQAPTLIGSTAAMESDDFELVIDFGIGGGAGEFYGGGQSMPTRNYKTQHDVTGRLTILQATAEETAFKNRTTGKLEFTLHYPGGTHSLVITIPKAKYITYVKDQAEGRFITAQLTYGALSTDLSDVLTITVA
jgi:hypothetical protein